jgi:hypothetical protein
MVEEEGGGGNDKNEDGRLNLIEFVSRVAGDADPSKIGHQASALCVAPSRAGSYLAEMLGTPLSATAEPSAKC